MIDCECVCRWSTLEGIPTLYFTYDLDTLQLLDVEKQKFMLKEPFGIGNYTKGENHHAHLSIIIRSNCSFHVIFCKAFLYAPPTKLFLSRHMQH